MAGRGPDERWRRCPPGSGRSESSSVRTPEERPERRNATSGAPEVRVPVTRYAAPQGAKFDLAPFGAPLPHVCEGKGNDGGPHAGQTTGAMTHACLAASEFARERGLFDT